MKIKRMLLASVLALNLSRAADLTIWDAVKSGKWWYIQSYHNGSFTVLFERKKYVIKCVSGMKRPEGGDKTENKTCPVLQSYIGHTVPDIDEPKHKVGDLYMYIAHDGSGVMFTRLSPKLGVLWTMSEWFTVPSIERIYYMDK